MGDAAANRAAAVRTLAILAVWLGIGKRLGRAGFYIVFACAVTLSVQLVGVDLVVATLIVPPLATRALERGRLAASWAVGAGGYAIGLALSTSLDLPSGAVVVWVMVARALVCYAALGVLRGERPAPSVRDV